MEEEQEVVTIKIFHLVLTPMDLIWEAGMETARWETEQKALEQVNYVTLGIKVNLLNSQRHQATLA